jgi:MFS family permease
MQLLQLPNVLLLRRFHRRKFFTISFATAGRLALLGVPLTLLFLPSPWLPAAIFASFFAWSAFGAMASGAWLWWMQDLVPAQRLGSYFGRRGAVLLAVSAPLLIGAGLLLDYASAARGPEGERMAFAFLYVLAAACGVASSAALSLIPDRPPKEDPRGVRVGASLWVAFTDPNFRTMLLWLAMWGFGSTLSIPFFAVFMLIELALPVTTVTVVLGLGTVTNILFLRLWGDLSDRFGNKPVLAVVAPVLGAAMALTPFVSHADWRLQVGLLLVIQVLIAVAVAGADLTAWNLAFKLGRGPHAPSYLAGTSLVRALSTGTGPIIGGALATALAATSATVAVPVPGIEEVPLAHLSAFSLLFLLSAALLLFSTTPLTRVREEGEAPRSELMRALRVAAASQTLLPGVRHFATASTVAVDGIVAADERARRAISSSSRALRAAAQASAQRLDGTVPPPPGQP